MATPPDDDFDDILASLHDPSAAENQAGGDAVFGEIGAQVEAEELIDQQAVPEFRDDPNLNPFNLTPKELMFCYAYARAGNGAQAARYGGYAGGGSQAVKLLQRDDIQAEIRRQRSFINSTAPAIAQPATPEEVLGRFWDIANVSEADLFVLNPDGKTYRYIALADMPPALRRAIKRIQIGKDGTIVDIKLHDSVAALVRLAAYQGLNSGRGMGPWSDTGGARGESGEAEEEITPGLPSAPSTPLTSITFEQRVNADGSEIRKRIFQRSG